ncbi:Rpn family recombination-promoting nuclease/putative transposase [Hyalangium sp.]|uniref:Rpn family recombination-promoting nuclease/putative transposase n=1 Tax=Hyalangium sp. TaxID=2028555 RepID=UPI002D3F87E6|nr:Rpn family recombination-promoting nuclease/putative transposase [Hyalangium sp.]HYI01968.1 Rpn family recombination-promoting nuclease/putative transposase [Hyalangium sp.]
MSGPHDRFVRYTLGHPARAAAELRAALPANLVAQVDWSTLRREPSNVVDAQLRETQSDLLFSAQLTGGEPVLIFVLIEHQVDAKTRRRILSCTDTRLLDQWFDRALNASSLAEVLGESS